MTARPPALRLGFDELIIDNFAGGGGASTGIWAATGRAPNKAINHDPEALAVYKANHPDTDVLCEDVFDVDPRMVCGGRPVGLAWFSPDCTFFSKSRGAKPHRDRDRARRRRGLAGVVLKWAEQKRPRVICVENVEEFKDWGPLMWVEGHWDCRRNRRKWIPGGWLPDPEKKGTSFRRWVARLRNLGYVVEWRELRACDFGAPTSRKRLFIVARCDGELIVWPERTHFPPESAVASGGLPYRTAAECIDWSIPCPSIFDRKKPLAEATLRRIARGIRKYVLDAARPFLVPVSHQGDERAHSIDEPVRTITGAHRGEYAVAAPVVARIGQTGGGGKYVNGADEPVTTVTTKAEHLLVAPTLVRTDMYKSNAGCAYSAEDPLRTITSGGGHAVVTPLLTPVKSWGGGGNEAAPADKPLRTVTASKRGEHALVVPTLITTSWGEREGQAPRVPGLDKPLGTIMADGQKHAVVAAFLSKAFGGHGVVEKQSPNTAMSAPVGTVTGRDHNNLVASTIVKLKGTCRDGQPVDVPLATVQAQGLHYAEVRAFLARYCGAEVRDDEGGPVAIVTIDGVEYAIVDIGMRMLSPRELYNAQGFPKSYVIDPIVERRRGKRVVSAPLTKTEQVRKCGNAVPPPFSEAIVRAQFTAREEEKVA